ncbi:MAG: hypothetical protein IPG06_15680 [Haliea sp.]|nr:hypothetical protein [Haliea sp.]
MTRRATCPFSKDPDLWLVNGGDPLNFAHRGGVTDFPENTLCAYAEAARAGRRCTGNGCLPTKDNQLVILHDLDFYRTTNGQGNVVDMTPSRLRCAGCGLLVCHRRRDAARPTRCRLQLCGIATGDKAPTAGV